MGFGTITGLAVAAMFAAIGAGEAIYMVDRKLRMVARDRLLARMAEIKDGAPMTEPDEGARLSRAVIRCVVPRVGPGALQRLARFDTETRVQAALRAGERDLRSDRGDRR